MRQDSDTKIEKNNQVLLDTLKMNNPLFFVKQKTMVSDFESKKSTNSKKSIRFNLDGVEHSNQDKMNDS